MGANVLQHMPITDKLEWLLAVFALAVVCAITILYVDWRIVAGCVAGIVIAMAITWWMTRAMHRGR